MKLTKRVSCNQKEKKRATFIQIKKKMNFEASTTQCMYIMYILGVDFPN